MNESSYFKIVGFNASLQGLGHLIFKFYNCKLKDLSQTFTTLKHCKKAAWLQKLLDNFNNPNIEKMIKIVANSKLPKKDLTVIWNEILLNFLRSRNFCSETIAYFKKTKENMYELY